MALTSSHEIRRDAAPAAPITGSPVDPDHLSSATQERQRIIDDTDVDSAHRTQVLCDHDIRVQISQRVSVQVVQILTPRQRRRHRHVDLSRAEPGRQSRRRHDAARARLRRIITLERHADNVPARTNREQDLCRRRQQGNNPHTETVSPGGWRNTAPVTRSRPPISPAGRGLLPVPRIIGWSAVRNPR